MSSFPSSSSIDVAKSSLRRQMKARLRELVVDRQATADAVYRNLCALPEFCAADVVALYLDFGAELPTRPFVPNLFEKPPIIVRADDRVSPRVPQPRREVAVPFCEGKEMFFYRLDPPERDSATQEPIFLDLEPATFGILEPNAARRRDPSRRVLPAEIDVVLVPGLAFDPQGGRLGRGAGFYDRFLPTLPPTTRLIGIAFDEQIVPQAPTEPFDFPIQTLVTPTQILRIDSPSVAKNRSTRFS